MRLKTVTSKVEKRWEVKMVFEPDTDAEEELAEELTLVFADEIDEVFQVLLTESPDVFSEIEREDLKKSLNHETPD